MSIGFVNKELKDFALKIQDSLEKTLKDIISNANIDKRSRLYRTSKVTSKVTLRDDIISDYFIQDYAIYVDRGRRAGAKPPPVSAIYDWMKRKKIKGNLSVAYAISKAIARDGIKPRPFIAQYESVSVKMADKMLDEFLDRLTLRIYRTI